MLGTEDAALDLQGLAVKRLGLRVVALRPVNVGQIVHRGQRVGMLGTQDAAPELQSLALERLGLCVLVL